MCAHAACMRAFVGYIHACIHAQVSVVDQLGLPVKFLGVGETAADLQPFNAESFAEALFPNSKA